MAEQERQNTTTRQDNATMPYLAIEEGQAAEEGEIAKRSTTPLPVMSTPLTPLPEVMEPPTNTVDEALERLNDAARRIAIVEQHKQNFQQRRAPKALRLAPIRDISSDIQRASTPLPRTPYSTQHIRGSAQTASEAKGENLPDFWPWLDDGEDDEMSGSGEDSWSNRTDPLLRRRFPLRRSSVQDEQIDIAVQETGPQMTVSRIKLPQVKLPPVGARLIHFPTITQGKQLTRLRTIFFCLAICAILALVIDGLLASTLFFSHSGKAVASNSPTLLLSSSVVKYGQSVSLSLRHFSRSSHVMLTRNVGESVKLNTGNPLVRVDESGNADVTLYVEKSWNPGFQTIEAEDINTRYTANATLRLNAGLVPPPGLSISPTQLNFGADVQGTNSMQTVTLQNSGSGTISWSASSAAAWLQLTPNQGSFSDNQTIEVAIQRANLKPGNYTGTITFAYNEGAPQMMQVQMIVSPLPANTGAVLTVTPAVLAFTATDGGADPKAQFIQMSNPGAKPLYWSIDHSAANASSQPAYPASLGPGAGWLSTDAAKGIVPAGGAGLLRVSIHSHNLLPGTYLSELSIGIQTGFTALNSPQKIAISLTVQPSCGVTLSSSSLPFTAVAGQNAPGALTLTLTATASCPGTIAWRAVSPANWLTITPTSGQLHSATSGVTTIGVNTVGLKPGLYTTSITITAAQSTQTVGVQLNMQNQAPALAPLLGASPLNLNFSTTVGQPDPPGQAVTVTNTGGSALRLHASASTQSASWLSASPTDTTIAPGQTGKLTVTIKATALMPGTYSGQVTLSGSDSNNIAASGSPLTIMVSLVVQPPCTLAQPSASALAFSAPQGSTDPTPQSVTITASGNCSWPLKWTATVASSPSWLALPPTSGTLNASGQSSTLTIAPSIAGLAPGTYNAQVSISALDASNQTAQGSPQTLTVTLTVQQLCALQVATSNLTFSVMQGQSAAAQNLAFSETGNCAFPVAWTATGASASSNWLALSATSGQDSGSGNTIGVSANASNLTPGTYKGTITISASNSGNITLQGSPQSVPVTLTVTGFTITGTVTACSSNPCSNGAPLAGATVSITDSANNVVASAAADTSGNFTITNIPAGTYTLSVSGSDSTKVNYAGSVSLPVPGNQQGIQIDAFASS